MPSYLWVKHPAQVQRKQPCMLNRKVTDNEPRRLCSGERSSTSRDSFEGTVKESKASGEPRRKDQKVEHGTPTILLVKAE